ncbi:Putative secreted serine protease, subtilisin MEROPS family S8A [Campylobacter devanensis]|uniref:Autotransporter serine protease n=2 Tax=Campylobacter devanensis TaxID=3161138 RepID=A0A1X9SQK2_9BACT|nr:S8 family serine peptidase [Campylobacter lanienae]ARQ98544.1 putative autotransporter serine protease [Campylobacter lanienae]SUX01598.1 Putative secreted serine protease, subtilisin MEROPS family S8A [Campylobacter lanienae]
MKSIKLSLILPIYLFGVTDFELINYNDNSVSGDGVFVGVIDSAINKDHPSLSGQIQDQIYSGYKGGDYTPDFSVDTHGSHVAGIILAKPSDGVSGVATDAKAYGVQITGHNTDGSSKFTAPNVYEYFKDKNIAAINNSWNATVYPLSGLNSLTSSSISFLKNANNPNDYIPLIQRDSTASDLIKLSKEKQILSVFASGNEGIISPGIMALAPYYDEEIRSIIVVTALDSAQVSKDSDGKFIVTTKRDDNYDYLSAPTTYSNGLKGVYNFGLTAPGTGIKNVNASYGTTDILTGKLDKDLYRVSSGTSMAAPMVTGAAALVAQKFPFMSGKQIADTLLSTANKDYIGPKIIVKETVTGKTLCDGNVLCSSSKRYTIFYVDSKIPKNEDGSVNEKAVEKDLLNSGYFGINWKYDRMSGMAAIDDEDYPWVQEVTKEDLFGQGILDIDKALKGIGILDANRLSDADVRSEFGETAVYYALDTKGSDTEFGNDISQRKWEANTHNPEANNLPKNLDNLNVGLIKSGSGVLTLSGANSYEGATVINAGGIRLLSKDSKTAQIAGSVYVNNGSILSGNGVIKQNLTNDNSIIRPGNGDLSDLIVDGTYMQKGQNSKLILDFGNDDNSQLIAKDYSISGGNLEYNPLAQYYTVNKEIKIQLGGLATHIGNFANVEIASNNSISFEIKLDSDKTTINKDPISIPPIHETEVPSNPQNPTPPSSENVTPPQSEQPNTPSQPVAPSEPNNNQNNNQQAPNNNQNNQQNGNQQSPSNSQNSGSQSSNSSQGGTTSPSNPPSSENVTPPQSEQPNTPSQPVAPSEPNNNQNNNQQAPNNNQNNQQNGNQQSPSNSQNSGSQSSNSSQGGTTSPSNPPSSENVTPPQSEQPNTPSQPVAPSEPNNNQNNNQQAPNNNQNNQQNGNQQSPSNSQNSGSIIVTPVVKPNAYNSNSTTLSQTMRNIRSNVNLSSKYNQFFNTLDSSDSNTYQETMSRIEGNSVFDLTSIITQNHTSFYQNNMLFSINPVSSTLFSYNSNPYDSGIFVASVASDYAIDLGFDSLKPKNYWYINPTYKRYNGNGFDGYQSGVSVNLAHKLDDGIISYGVGASKSSLDFDIGATAKSSNFDIALNYTHDFESFKLLSGGSFMVSFNENERIVANTLSSDYKSYSSSLQLGVAKDFRHYSIVVTPLGYLGYGKIYQESFKESGGIFAKNYDSINHDLYTVGLGLNLAYEGSDEKSRYTGYIIYERMLDGYNMDASAEFNDFKGQKFSQRYHLDKNRLNLGVGAEYTFNSGYFAKFGIGSEFATTSDNYNLSVTFGKRF